MRRHYLDWMRGLAVLIMIEAHIIDSWTRVSDRHAWAFGWSLILGGFGAPLFLLLAGVAVALSSGSKLRKTNDRRTAAHAVEKRGLEIFLLAFVFRFQAYVISRSAARAMLKVDILNIMGPAIVGTAFVWGACRSLTTRLVAFGAATAVLVFATPLIRTASWPGALPDVVEAYLRPVPGLTNFSIFPWAAFVPLGAIIGTFIERTRAGADEQRVNVILGAGGALVAVAAYFASWLPTPYPRSDFWTSSPAFFFLRAGLMTSTIALVYAWERRPHAGERWTPMRLLGRHSLFIYWIHVEMVYGVISLPLHHAMTLWQSWVSLAAFSSFMLVAAIFKDRLVKWWKGRGTDNRVANSSLATS